MVIGYGKNITVTATAVAVKEYAMDDGSLSPGSGKPQILASGNKTFTWTAERLYTDGAFTVLLLNGTAFDLVFAPTGSPEEAPYEFLEDCVVLGVEHRAGEDGAILERVNGEAKDLIPSELD